MKRKIIALVLAAAMIMAAVISGTLAYLTDSDEAVNVFSVGDVDIRLDEKGGIRDIAGNLLGGDRCTGDSDSGYTYSGIVPTNRIEKKVTVENIGESSAYVRVAVVVNNFDKISKATNFFETLYGKDEFKKIDEAYAELFDGWYMTHYKETDKDALVTNPNSVRRTVSAQSLQAADYNSGEVIGVDYSYTTYDCNYFNYGNLFKSEAEEVAADVKNSYIGRASEGHYSKFLKDYECVYVYYLKLDKDESVTLFNGFNIPAEFTAEQLEMFNGLKIEIYADAIQTEGFNVDENHKTLSPVEDAELIAINAFTALEAAHPLHERRKLTDEWDGTADTALFTNYEDDDEFIITTAEELAGFAKMVDEGNTFEGKTVKLDTDIDLYFLDGSEPKSFDPIGDDSPFKGTFDGDGHTIYNLYQSGWAFGYEWGSYGSIGLFGELEDATVKNLTISGAETFVEGGDVGGIAGSASGDCVFENITISDSDIATYNNGNGGIIGWSGAGNYTFKNVNIESDVVLAGLWGSFDSSIGGIVGQAEPGATYNFENVNIECRIDAYNDVTASYDYYNYRMCGMIIGRLEETTTIDGKNYPDVSKYNINCKDVTVTYGEWANYHYCRAEGARGKRVEAGYAYDGIAADYDHSVCTVHHMELIPFDQIFGGDQYGVKGLPSHNGVTVVYNNK